MDSWHYHCEPTASAAGCPSGWRRGRPAPSGACNALAAVTAPLLGGFASSGSGRGAGASRNFSWPAEAWLLFGPLPYGDVKILDFAGPDDLQRLLAAYLQALEGAVKVAHAGYGLAADANKGVALQ